MKYHLTALTVTARGLGLDVLVHNFLKVQSAPNQLVLVINMRSVKGRTTHRR